MPLVVILSSGSTNRSRDRNTNRRPAEQVSGHAISAGLASADPEDKAEVYRQLGTRLSYEPANRLVRAEAGMNPQPWGYGKCPRGCLSSRHRSHLSRDIVHT